MSALSHSKLQNVQMERSASQECEPCIVLFNTQISRYVQRRRDGTHRIRTSERAHQKRLRVTLGGCDGAL